MMKMNSFTKKRAIIGGLCLLGALFASPATAQSSNPDRLRAAIVFNVLRFVEFPASTGDSITFCVDSNYRGASAFRSFSGKRAGDRTVSVRNVNAGAYSGCDVAYLASESRANISRVSRNGRVVMGDGRNFIDNGGTVGFVQTGNQIRFQLNMAKASSSNLAFSSRLIRLSSKVVR